jgi:hypothetical protein
LLGGIANDAKELLLQEVALTKLEVRYELLKAKTAAIALGIGIATIAMGGLLLLFMLVHLLAVLTVVPLWGATALWGSRLLSWAGYCSLRARPKQRKWTWYPRERRRG